MSKRLEDLSIMELAIRNTDPNLGRGHIKRAFSCERRKEEIDSVIKYCTKCKRCWSQPPYAVDAAGFRWYPKGNIPTIGKKRKTCKTCRSKK